MQKRTVFMYAIDAKLEALCDKLIEKGADINARTKRQGVSHPSSLVCVGQHCIRC